MLKSTCFPAQSGKASIHTIEGHPVGLYAQFLGRCQRSQDGLSAYRRERSSQRSLLGGLKEFIESLPGLSVDYDYVVGDSPCEDR